MTDADDNFKKVDIAAESKPSPRIMTPRMAAAVLTGPSPRGTIKKAMGKLEMEEENYKKA